mmetsp:Transcript_100517/g.174512  ORF Transcript_100517/g.174512 Transcript_100517/m.174512 type:complete len:260 (+) Transcript_100517:85-864(+)
MINVTRALPIPESCDAKTQIAMAALFLVGIVVCFAGYRLYVLALGLSGFVMVATIQIVTRFSWISPGEEEEHLRIIKVLGLFFFCLLWGGIGAVPCTFTKFSDKLKRCLGFILGAAIGTVLVVALIYLLRQPVSDVLGAGYEGWEFCAFVSVAPAFAFLIGWLARKQIKYCLMLVTAFLGAAVAVCCLELILVCFVENFDVVHIPMVPLYFVGAFGLLGVSVQVNLDSAEPAEVGKSGEDEVGKSEKHEVGKSQEFVEP